MLQQFRGEAVVDRPPFARLKAFWVHVFKLGSGGVIFMMRKIGAAVLAGFMLTSTLAVAASPANVTQGALAPGKAAGVKEAQLNSRLWFWLLGLGFVAGGILLVTSSNSNGSATTTTGGTP